MTTDSLTKITGDDSNETLAQARRHMSNGGLVVVPTETVYGIAIALGQAEARNAVRKLKKVDGPLSWVIHVAKANDVARYIEEIPAAARSIMSKGWPGPIALRLRHTPAGLERLRALAGAGADEADEGGFYTFRCPDVPITRKLLTDFEPPVAIIGAAMEGFAANAVEAVSPEIIGGAGMVFDAGPVRYHRPSTLVQVDGDAVTVRRPGVIDGRLIERMATSVLLFVCSGNTCRSPMAAGIARMILEERGRRELAQSAGLYAHTGSPATPEAVAAAGMLGADIGGHVSQGLTPELLRRATAVYTMTEAHRDEILARAPWAGEKVRVLDKDGDIEDPIGGDTKLYYDVALRLERAIKFQLDGMDHESSTGL